MRLSCCLYAVLPGLSKHLLRQIWRAEVLRPRARVILPAAAAVPSHVAAITAARLVMQASLIMQ